MATQDQLESDWIYSVFEVLRDEVVSLAADFGERVKREVDQVAGTQAVRPPSTLALLTSVAIETGNMAGALLQRADESDREPDKNNHETLPAADARPDEEPEDT